ncbi:trans-sialidase [Trypanosoma cruzi]|nr:trans-sialidase [Trypanosoma cruzi]
MEGVGDVQRKQTHRLLGVEQTIMSGAHAAGPPTRPSYRSMVSVWDAKKTSSSGKGPRTNSHFYIGGDGSSASDKGSQNKYVTVTSVFLYHRILTREEAAKVGASNLPLPESLSGKMLEGPDDPAGTDSGSKDGNASQLTNNTFLKKGSSGYGTVRVCVCVSDPVASPSGAVGIAALSCVRRWEWSRDSP